MSSSLQIQDPRSVDILYPYRDTDSHKETFPKLQGLIDKVVPHARKITCVLAALNHAGQMAVVKPFERISPPGTRGVLPPVILNSLRRNWALGRMPTVASFDIFWQGCSSIACVEFVDVNKDSPELKDRVDSFKKWYHDVFYLIATHRFHSSDDRDMPIPSYSEEAREAFAKFHIKYKVIVVAKDQTELSPEQVNDLKEILATKPPRLPEKSNWNWMRGTIAVSLIIAAIAIGGVALRTLFRTSSLAP